MFSGGAAAVRSAASARQDRCSTAPSFRNRAASRAFHFPTQQWDRLDERSSALRLAFGNSGGGEGEREKAAAGMVLDMPLGSALLGLLGAAFLAAAAHQAIKAWTTEFAKDLDPQAPAWAVPAGRAGLAARSVVFAVIGASLVRAGWFGAAGEVKGLGDALSSLTDNPPLYLLVAAGLFLFGVHSFVEARWRRMRDEDMIARLASARRR